MYICFQINYRIIDSKFVWVLFKTFFITGSQDVYGDSDSEYYDGMEQHEISNDQEEDIHQSSKSISPPSDSDYAVEGSHPHGGKDVSNFATPARHRRRRFNATKFRHSHSPSQHRRRVLRRCSSGGSD